MKRKKIVILPEFNNCGGDLNKKWFIYYSYRDPRNDKMKRFKEYEGLHKIKSFKERTEAAEKLRDHYCEKLKAGWNPFLDDAKIIYEDQLQYNNVARIFGKMRLSNKTVRYYSSQYIKHRQSGNEIEPETIATYRSRLRILNLWLEKRGIVDEDISSIDNTFILEFFSFLINEEFLSATTIKRYMQLFRAVFELSKKEKAIIDNPVYDIPKCKRINDQSPRPIADFDIMAFKEIIMREDPQLWLAISFEYYCFLRPGKELRFLKIGEIDFARGVIDVDALRAKTTWKNSLLFPWYFFRNYGIVISSTIYQNISMY